MKLTDIIIAAALLCIASGCGNNASPKPSETPVAIVGDTSASAVSSERHRNKMLVSKGVIRSASEVKVFSRIEGQLLDVPVLEGRKVSKGQVIFRLEDQELKSKLLLSESQWEQSKLRMEEILVSQGYKRSEMDKIPENVINYAKIKSGVNICGQELSIARSKVERTVIRAAQSGVITGVKALSFAYVKPGETLCTIVDPDHLIAHFSVLETEVSKFSIGTKVEVYALAYSDIPYSATVRTISSIVDENGMIEVEAVIDDSRKLMPGMTAVVTL